MNLKSAKLFRTCILCILGLSMPVFCLKPITQAANAKCLVWRGESNATLGLVDVGWPAALAIDHQSAKSLSGVLIIGVPPRIVSKDARRKFAPKGGVRHYFSGTFDENSKSFICSDTGVDASHDLPAIGRSHHWAAKIEKFILRFENNNTVTGSFPLEAEVGNKPTEQYQAQLKLQELVSPNDSEQKSWNDLFPMPSIATVPILSTPLKIFSGGNFSVTQHKPRMLQR